MRSAPGATPSSCRAAAKSGLKIGDTIKLAKQKDGASNGLTRRTFKISAFVTSPSYLGTDNATYGASDLGDGGVNGICWLVEDAFDPKFFNDAKPYVTLRSQDLEGLSSFDDTYHALTKALDDRVDLLGSTLAAARYEELHTKAEDALEEGQNAYDEAETSLSQARDDLDRAQQSYDDSVAMLDQMSEPQRSLLAAQLDEQAVKLDDARTEIEEGEPSSRRSWPTSRRLVRTSMRPPRPHGSSCSGATMPA